MNNYEELREVLAGAGMKVTPQRIGVLDAVKTLNHPSAEKILVFIKDNYPGVSTGTVYSILESLVEKGIIHKVKTDSNTMRYDAVMNKHHHLYCSDCDKVEDYYDDDLNRLLNEYFERKAINGFIIEDIKVQIVGKFFNNR